MPQSAKSVALLAATVMVLALAGCQKQDSAAGEKGPAEQAGEKIDQAAARAGEELNTIAEKAGKGLQQLGQKIQDEAERAQQDKKE